MIKIPYRKNYTNFKRFTLAILLLMLNLRIILPLYNIKYSMKILKITFQIVLNLFALSVKCGKIEICYLKHGNTSFPIQITWTNIAAKSGVS